MGWISDLFGTSETPAPLITSTQASIPGYMEDYSKSQLQLATALGNRPFEPFTGERVAGFTPQQQTAFDMADQNAGAWRPGMQNVTDTVQSNMNSTWPTADLQSYMNPYRDTMKTAINESYGQMANQSNAGAINANAFGGTRQGVEMGTLLGKQGQALADVDRQAYADAYDKWAADRTNQMAGAQALQSATDNTQRLGAADVASLSAAGAQQQGLNQLQLDAQRAGFDEAQNYPIDMFNLRQSALSGMPYASSQNVSTQQASQNNLAGTIGSLASLGGGVGQFFSAPSGGTSAWDGIKKAWNEW